MSMEIIDMISLKCRVIKCPNCESKRIEVNCIFENEDGKEEYEYICRSCEEVFELDYDYRTYEEGGIDEEEWNDLDEDAMSLIGYDIEE